MSSFFISAAPAVTHCPRHSASLGSLQHVTCLVRRPSVTSLGLRARGVCEGCQLPKFRSAWLSPLPCIVMCFVVGNATTAAEEFGALACGSAFCTDVFRYGYPPAVAANLGSNRCVALVVVSCGNGCMALYARGGNRLSPSVKIPQTPFTVTIHTRPCPFREAWRTLSDPEQEALN